MIAKVKLLILFSLFMLHACVEETGSKEQRMAFIHAQVEERIEEYKNIIDRRCNEKVLEEASRQADSILLVRARLKRDTTGKPQRPDKPSKPEVKTIIDSIPVAPLFKDSTSGSQGGSIE